MKNSYRQIELRKYKDSDCQILAEIFYQTVHSINVKDYTQEQVAAWATGTVNLQDWNKSFLEHYTIVAVKNDKIVGFGDIDESGYLDRLFIHKSYQRQGIASAICDALERFANTRKITTHVSITARPFFEQRGYKAIQEQTVVRNGVALKNFIMEKASSCVGGRFMSVKTT